MAPTADKGYDSHSSEGGKREETDNGMKEKEGGILR